MTPFWIVWEWSYEDGSSGCRITQMFKENLEKIVLDDTGIPVDFIDWMNFGLHMCDMIMGRKVDMEGEPIDWINVYGVYHSYEAAKDAQADLTSYRAAGNLPGKPDKTLN
jgi:hypothetical protein